MSRGAIATLWQSRILRFSKLAVSNEIENALSFYNMTFLDVIPELLQDLELHINQTYADELTEPYTLPNIMPMGSWIGGDRDGNPFVTSAVTEEVLLLARRRAAKLFALDLDDLYIELSMNDLHDKLRSIVG